MSTTVTSPNNSARTVVGLMGFAVGFSLLGNEIQVAQGQSNNKLKSGLSKGGTIIVGGLIAAALLSAITGAGEPARKFAVGLATVTAVTSALVYGGPAWSALNTIVNGKTGKGSGGTTATTATTATGTTSGTAPAKIL